MLERGLVLLAERLEEQLGLGLGQLEVERLKETGLPTDTGKVRSESGPAKTVVETGSTTEGEGSPMIKSGIETAVSMSD
ncbi:MAG: hypothetical protein J07HQW2_02414 [Haloquadratum walsbyi J07HQW2]|jgi:hypothetical protein|uniref:Uncharacterized protein n=2 Tax=Haloquadratum walsbyi TaxID=293091 RepID=U1NGK3_9EURY|nr:hypothetical protein [Haloquadratum walsbyi]ERG95953.1 MAG: hypothetical protein J07HQW2_02414 [Haloquadratum walsbyi J07HQW2]